MTRRAGLPISEAAAQIGLAFVGLARGDYAAAQAIAAPAVAVAQPMTPAYTFGLMVLVQAALAQGDVDEAESRLAELAALTGRGLVRWAEGWAHVYRCQALLLRGSEPVDADTAAHHALALHHELGERWGTTASLDAIAEAAAALDSPAEAVRLLAAADAERTRSGYDMAAHDRVRHIDLVGRLRASMGDDFDAAWAARAPTSTSTRRWPTPDGAGASASAPPRDGPASLRRNRRWCGTSPSASPTRRSPSDCSWPAAP